MNVSPLVIADAEIGRMTLREVGDRAQQVCLADAGGAADEEWVVRVAREFSDRQRRGVGEPVAVADDELLEGELGVGRGVELVTDLERCAGVRAAVGDVHLRAVADHGAR